MKRSYGVDCRSACLIAGMVTVLLHFGCAQVKAPTSAVALPPPSQPSAVAVADPPKEPLPDLILTEREEKTPEKVFTFTLRDADIHEVLLAISKQSTFNIIVDPDVQGKVTMDLRDVTLRDALDTLTDLLGLTYKVKQNVIRVSKPALETRIFSLHYVSLKRTGTSSTTAQIGAGIGGAASGVGGGGAATTGGSASGGSAGGQTSVTTTSDTDLWSNMETSVAKLLSAEGKVVVDKQSGSILVTDYPKFLDRVANFIEQLEGAVQRQVLIEARIVEVTLTGDYRFGIDWSAVAKVGALRGNAFEGRIFSQALAPADTRDFQIGVTSTDFEALLNVLSTQGEVNVLSSPKLAALNNQTAILKAATDDVFFITETERTPGASGGFDTFTTVTPRTVTVGVVLAVTPQISSDGSVILHVRPTVSRKSGESSISTADTTITVPILDVREADVVVRAREGQVVVIGGLIEERKSNDESKVPLLGDIPGVGRLFRKTIEDRKKTELVVLLRPDILADGKVEDITARELGRLEALKGANPW